MLAAFIPNDAQDMLCYWDDDGLIHRCATWNELERAFMKGNTDFGFKDIAVVYESLQAKAALRDLISKKEFQINMLLAKKVNAEPTQR